MSPFLFRFSRCSPHVPVFTSPPSAPFPRVRLLPASLPIYPLGFVSSPPSSPSIRLGSSPVVSDGCDCRGHGSTCVGVGAERGMRPVGGDIGRERACVRLQGGRWSHGTGTATSTAGGPRFDAMGRLRAGQCQAAVPTQWTPIDVPSLVPYRLYQRRLPRFRATRRRQSQQGAHTGEYTCGWRRSNCDVPVVVLGTRRTRGACFYRSFKSRYSSRRWKDGRRRLCRGEGRSRPKHQHLEPWKRMEIQHNSTDCISPTGKKETTRVMHGQMMTKTKMKEGRGERGERQTFARRYWIHHRNHHPVAWRNETSRSEQEHLSTFEVDKKVVRIEYLGLGIFVPQHKPIEGSSEERTSSMHTRSHATQAPTQTRMQTHRDTGGQE